MGNPHGLKQSVVQGIVSGRRTIEGKPMIQLAIPIEPGNSGGPLLDARGKVHGILTLKSVITQNLGFAVEINALKPLITPADIHRWRDAWRKQNGNDQQLWGNERPASKP